MMTQMDPLLKRYVDEVRNLRGHHEEEVVHLLARYLQDTADDPRNRTFLQAERFFYQKQYKEALQNYLQTKENAPDPFFSYRASACLLAERGQVDKALEFARRALSLYPKDPDLLHLLREQGKQTHEQHLSPQEPEDELDTIAGFGVEPEGKPIEHKVPSLSAWQQNEWLRYLSYYGQKETQDDILYLFDGLSKNNLQSFVEIPHHQRHGGFFIRWKGEGIVLNPGPDFLEQLHSLKFSLRDIHTVIMTSSLPENWAGLRSIYEGHCQLHRAAPSEHMIHYYIASLGTSAPPSWLRPRFRQEAYTIHPLEFYWDGEGGECRRLSDTLTLHYFRFTDSCMSCLLQLQPKEEAGEPVNGIHIDVNANKHTAPITIGYLPHPGPALLQSDDSWLEAFKNSTVLLTGLSLTPFKLEQLHPRLAIFCEQEASQGDNRLAQVQQTRKALARSDTVVLPADVTLRVGLSPLAIYCSRTGSLMDLKDVHVLSPLEPFGRLEYTQNAL